jgi:hypothetical protein
MNTLHLVDLPGHPDFKMHDVDAFGFSDSFSKGPFPSFAHLFSPVRIKTDVVESLPFGHEYHFRECVGVGHGGKVELWAKGYLDGDAKHRALSEFLRGRDLCAMRGLTYQLRCET